MLLAAVLGLAVAEGLRPWKRLQLEFHELERQQLRSRLDAARAAAVEPLAELEARVATQAALLADRQDEIVELEDDLRAFGGKSRAAKLRRSRLESELELALHPSSFRETAAAELTEELRQTRMEIESFDELIVDREGKLAAVRSDLDAARGELARARAPIEQLEDRLAALPARPVLPTGGLLAPGVAVREIALPAAAGDRARVDRCVTCHLAAPRDDLDTDDWPAPLRSHPTPELFPGADSPHPYPRFGCTPCHGGEGRATDFSRAGHTPASAEQADRWREDLGWRPGNGRTMLPRDLTAAACGRCHGDELPHETDVAVPQARLLEHGRRLIAALGCTACHADDAPAERGSPSPSVALAEAPGPSPRVGPSLIGIAGKTTPAWVHRWLEAPRDFRETTRMPHVFAPPEPADGDASARRSAKIRALVDYLWQVSRPAEHKPPPAGDVEAGRALFETVGCAGCHLLGLEVDAAVPEGRRHGPHLAGTGSKVDADWLYAWLRDPRAYRHDTPMPSLRLDEREAADLTAYLMTRRDPAWEGLSLPETDVETRDRLVLSALARDHTLEQSQARLERMSERNRNLYLGEQTIARYGCHGCHQIAGFEQATVAGPTLNEVGSRLRERLVWPGSGSLAGAPESRRWQAATHRPAYHLSDGETRAVTVALLGQADPAAPAGERTIALARGRRILERYNCKGCHRIEGRGGFLDREAELGPPDLAHAGARLKAPWLYEYLADPGSHQIRPWLEVRMPTFGLSAAENNALVRFFAALDDQPLFADEPLVPPPATDVAVGRVVFHLLQCGDCHQPATEESPIPQEAPSHAQASERLRPDWAVSLILDPERWLPGTSMPANFLPEGDEPGSSYLIGSISTPIFSVERERLLRLLGSQEELDAYLSDPERVATALRDYLWTLGR